MCNFSAIAFNTEVSSALSVRPSLGSEVGKTIACDIDGLISGNLSELSPKNVLRFNIQSG
jgi:hypothetical protein